MNESARLAVGESGNMGKLVVEFMTVDGDNRCPKAVQCIVGGQANVVLRMTDEAGVSTEMRIAVPPDAAASALWGEGSLVVDLEPETTASQAIEIEAYRVHVSWRPASADGAAN